MERATTKVNQKSSDIHPKNLECKKIINVSFSTLHNFFSSHSRMLLFTLKHTDGTRSLVNCGLYHAV